MSTDPTTRLDAMAEELGERDRLRRRAELVAQGRRDSGLACRDMIQVLATVLAISPHIRPTFDAAPGQIGRPIGPSDAELDPPPSARTPAEIPRQPRVLRGVGAPRPPGKLGRAAEGYRRRTRP